MLPPFILHRTQSLNPTAYSASTLFSPSHSPSFSTLSFLHTSPYHIHQPLHKESSTNTIFSILFFFSPPPHLAHLLCSSLYVHFFLPLPSFTFPERSISTPNTFLQLFHHHSSFIPSFPTATPLIPSNILHLPLIIPFHLSTKIQPHFPHSLSTIPPSVLLFSSHPPAPSHPFIQSTGQFHDKLRSAQQTL